jgi:acetolactate synthase-1/3 small subunit
MPSAPSDHRAARTVLKLIVRNHPGVMSHVCGLFARRAFNLEGVICVSSPTDSQQSIMLLMVNEDARLEQLVRQIDKLEDVLEIHRAPEASAAFDAVAGDL